MPWPFRRSAEVRRVESEMRGYGADLLEQRELLEADVVAKAEQLGWAQDAPGVVVVLGASGGATVALGGYGVAIRAQFKDKPKLTTPGPPDPIWLLAHALDDQHAIMDAFRVLVWGYASEVVAWLWPDQWAEVCDKLAKVMNVANDAEAKILDLIPIEPGLPLVDLMLQQVRHRDRLLATMAEAASRQEIASDNPWLEVAFRAWNDFYTEGQDTVAESLAQLAPDGLPTNYEYRPSG